MTDNSIKAQTIKIDSKTNSLTKALKKLVENNSNLIFTDGKVTASEWNATMDKLAEINQARKQSGQDSIFSGGTDKTSAGWQNSFIVHDGQEINFTAEEMKQLYDAMGVTVKSAPAEEPEEVEEEDPVEEVERSADPTPPAADLNQPAPVRAPSVIPQLALNPEHVPSNDCYPEKAGTEEKKGFGPFKKVITYDENGYIESVKTKYYTIYVERDEEGVATYYNKESYAKGQDVSENSNQYDKIEWYNSDMSPDGAFEYKYDENDNLISYVQRNADGTVKAYNNYEYNEQGLDTRYIERNPDGSVKCYTTYEYNADNEHVRSIKYNADGTVKAYYIIEYNEEGQGEYIYYDPEGNEITEREYYE